MAPSLADPRPDGVTLAVCTHNGATRLGPTLARIAAQADLEKGNPPGTGIHFELLVVDNASTDGTAETVKALWPAALADRLTIIREGAPGVAHARLRALREARFRFISFIDDDNWISPNWVREVHAIFADNPKVALLHCPSTAHLPGPEPADFPTYSSWLAIGSLVQEEGIVTRRPVSFWTAGLSVRLAALAFLDDPRFAFALSGRTGARTLGGEDHELCLCTLLGGWEAVFTHKIQFVHDIPMRRLEPDYLADLVENGGRSRRVLSEYRAAFAPDRFPTGLRLLAICVRDFAYRGAAYWLKRAVGRLPSAAAPSALSYRHARGRLVGYFETAARVPVARRNIAIARRFHAPDAG
ncbi:glycosyltransferase [Acuticoccus sp. I52.16.1]|uniref:glycosyltransferase n=1 Tax=Acuticoccus sp. I52.16.1 TaxID=2928472 RepID=UPI001FD059B6|nr:glycosyltransferase [Acuticoccus sp. I52.16.1]UOM36775.1 glycosyltransferase [Acuticoccus sp. I52.16.1]